MPELKTIARSRQDNIVIRVPARAALALLPLDRHELAACLDTMLRRVAPDMGASGRVGNLELICLRDADLARLNADCLGCHGPTNILAWPPGRAATVGFPEEAESEENTLGTLVLSADAVRREARLYGQDLAAYCRRLLAHGLAHVLGHSHGPGMDALCARMLDSCAEAPKHNCHSLDFVA